MNPIIAAHCGPTKLVLDYQDGSYDKITIRPDASVAPALAVKRVSFLDPNAAMVVYQDGSFAIETRRDVNPNAGIVQAFPKGRWYNHA